MNDASYTKYMLDECLPTIQNEGLALFLDGFIERDYFKLDALQHLIDASITSGLPLKIHVNQFYDIGGIQMAVEAGALSVDHLEVMSPEALKALHGSDTIATLLPSCSYFLGIPYGPARELIENDCVVALATDYNPGSSPSGNMQLVQSLACIKMKLTPVEAFNASTINAAAAINESATLGSITPGKYANLLVTQKIPSLGFIAYNVGHNHIEKVFLGGKEQQRVFN